MALYVGNQKVCPTVQVEVPVGVNNQDKTITSNGTYTADSGYTGLGIVTVNVSSSDVDINNLTKLVLDPLVAGNTPYNGYDKLYVDFHNGEGCTVYNPDGQVLPFKASMDYTNEIMVEIVTAGDISNYPVYLWGSDVVAITIFSSTETSHEYISEASLEVD